MPAESNMEGREFSMEYLLLLNQIPIFRGVSSVDYGEALHGVRKGDLVVGDLEYVCDARYIDSTQKDNAHRVVIWQKDTLANTARKKLDNTSVVIELDSLEISFDGGRTFQKYSDMVTQHHIE